MAAFRAGAENCKISSEDLVQGVRECSKTNGGRSKDMKGACNGYHWPNLGQFKHQDKKLFFSFTVCVFRRVSCIYRYKRDDRIRIPCNENRTGDDFWDAFAKGVRLESYHNETLQNST